MTNITKYTIDLNNWRVLTEIPSQYPQFSLSQLKHLFWKRKEHVGLSQCYRVIGKRAYVCLPLFGLWLAGELNQEDA